MTGIRAKSRDTSQGLLTYLLTAVSRTSGALWTAAGDFLKIDPRGVLGDGVGRELADLLWGSRRLGLGRRLLRFLR